MSDALKRIGMSEFFRNHVHEHIYTSHKNTQSIKELQAKYCKPQSSGQGVLAIDYESFSKAGGNQTKKAQKKK